VGSTFGIGHSSFGFIASLSASPVIHTVQVNSGTTTTTGASL
tara:strand:- start:247 stop:372 length:126 start_codon:yes stop_codon:yes gene_type:complete